MKSGLAVFLGVFVLIAATTSLGEDRPIVAVFDIEMRNVGSAEEKANDLTDYLCSLLSEKGYQVVPRSKLKESLQEKKKESYKQCYDQSCQIEIGQELAAQKSLSTQVLKLGGKCKVTVTLYNLKKSTSEKGMTVSGGCEEAQIVESLEKAVDKLVVGPGHAVEEAPTKAVTLPSGKAGLTWVKSAPAGVEFTKTEVTVAQYRSCFNEGKCSAPLTDSGCNWGAKRNDYPVNCVDWNQANTFCVWTGGRLPTELEWGAEATDRGTRKYPWGDEVVSCQRAIWGAGLGQTDGCGKESAWQVCSKPAGNSVSGLCDMCGNVWEWTSSWFEENKYRLVLGGSWYLEDEDVLRAPCRGRARPTRQDNRYGIRCVRSVK